MIQQNDFLEFALKQPRLVQMQIALYYPIHESYIEQYKDVIEWYGLSSNIHLNWSDHLIDWYEERWHWWQLQCNPAIKWDMRRIAKYIAKIDWIALCQNPSLELTEALLKQFGNQVNWYMLSQNPAFLQHADLVQKYKHKIEPIQKHQFGLSDDPNTAAFYMNKVLVDCGYEIPEALKKIMPLPPNQIELELISKYPDWWFTIAFKDVPNFEWTFERAEALYKPHCHPVEYENEPLYKVLVEPFLSDQVILNIWKNQRETKATEPSMHLPEKQIEDQEKKNELAWRHSVLLSTDNVAKYREKHPAKASMHPIVKALREKETELDVIFPDAYIRAMKPKNWNQVITKNGEYQIITPEKLSLLVGYDRDLPWLVKAVNIAENGGGDYLILAIKKENLCELGNEIYEVLHEMGTVQKIGTLG